MASALKQKRTLGVLFFLVLGISIAAAAAVAGDWGAAVALGIFYVVAAVVVWVWSGRSGDAAAVMRAEGDERQRAIDLRATAISGLAMGAFALAGTIVQLARGEDPSPFAWTMTVGGVAYATAFGVLRART